MVASISQLKQLGYKFIYDPSPQDGGLFVLRPKGYGKNQALERLGKETKESLEQAGVTVKEDSIYNYVSRSASLPGFGYAPGNVDTLTKVLDSAGSTIQAIETALKRVDPSEVNYIAVGNDDVPFDRAREILGQDVQFSREAQAQQAAEGEASAQAKDAQIAASKPKTRAQINAERIAASGKVPTSYRQDGDGTYSVLNATTGEVLDSGLSVDQALAVGQQISGGSTPSAIGMGTTDGITGGGTTPRSTVLPDWLDLSDFTDDQISQLEALWTGAGQNTNLVDKALSTVGDISITDEDMQKFLDEATEFYSGQGSYYAQTFQRLGEDYQRELDFQAKEREAQIAQTQLENLIAQEQQAEGFAEAGTARSGIRQLAEQRLAQQQEGIRESQSRQFGKSITDYGRKVEETAGSVNLTGVNIPTVGGQPIFAPTAGIRGSLEREQETAIQLKAQELAQQIAEGRAESLASRGDTSLYP